MKYILIISVLLAFTRCSKNSGPGSTPVPIPVLEPQVSIVYTGSGTIKFFYDVVGRVTHRMSGATVHSYIYTPVTITEEVDQVGSPFYARTIALNANGLPTSTSIPSISGFETQYFYNPDNSISTSVDKTAVPHKNMIWFYSNGNCDSVQHFELNGTWISTEKLTYYDLPNTRTLQHDGLTPFSDKEKKNSKLLKRKELRYPNPATVTFTNYTYNFDGTRILKMTGTNELGASFTYEYTYQ